MFAALKTVNANQRNIELGAEINFLMMVTNLKISFFIYNRDFLKPRPMCISCIRNCKRISVLILSFKIVDKKTIFQDVKMFDVLFIRVIRD